MTAMTNTARSGQVRQADQADARVADQITLALTALPRRGRRIALRRLALALANQRRTGDAAVANHFIESLVLTARLERMPAYITAMAHRPEPEEPLDVADVVALLGAHDRDPGT